MSKKPIPAPEGVDMSLRRSKSDPVQEHLARGGRIDQIPAGLTMRKADGPYKPGWLRPCRCGCEGNYTSHTERAGESGRSSSIVIK